MTTILLGVLLFCLIVIPPDIRSICDSCSGQVANSGGRVRREADISSFGDWSREIPMLDQALVNGKTSDNKREALQVPEEEPDPNKSSDEEEVATGHPSIKSQVSPGIGQKMGAVPGSPVTEEVTDNGAGGSGDDYQSLQRTLWASWGLQVAFGGAYHVVDIILGGGRGVRLGVLAGYSCTSVAYQVIQSVTSTLCGRSPGIVTLMSFLSCLIISLKAITSGFAAAEDITGEGDDDNADDDNGSGDQGIPGGPKYSRVSKNGENPV